MCTCGTTLPDLDRNLTGNLIMAVRTVRHVLLNCKFLTFITLRISQRASEFIDNQFHQHEVIVLELLNRSKAGVA